MVKQVHWGSIVPQLLSFLLRVTIAICLACSGAATDATQHSTTVPLLVMHNWIYIDVDFERPNGTLRKARLWVDSGNPEFTISESLGKDLRLDLSKITKNEDERSVASVQLPKMMIGGMPIETSDVHPTVLLGEPRSFPEENVDGNLPSTILKRYQLVLDYPSKRLTLAEAGFVKGKGTPIQCSIEPKTGMVSIKAEIAGKSFDVSLDSGSAFTLFSTQIVNAWSVEHSKWSRLEGAVGDANMFGAPYEAMSSMMRLSVLKLGSNQVQHAPVVSMPDNFFEWYSQKTTARVGGAIGGNILKLFRVFDYPDHVVYLDRQRKAPQHEFDLVGVVLAPSRDRDGHFGIRGIAKKHGAAVVESLEMGDKLLKVDGVDVQGESLGTVIDSLRGTPGERHRLLVARKEKAMEVSVKVMRLL